MTFDINTATALLLVSEGWTTVQPGTIRVEESMIMSEKKFVGGGMTRDRVIFIEKDSGFTVITDFSSILGYRFKPGEESID